MSNLFSGLEVFGLGDFIEKEIYESKHSINDEQDDKMLQESYLFDRKVRCPVCNHICHIRTVKTGKAKLITTDTDLRPIYEGIDPVLYDAALCQHCGYAALNRFFTKITPKQRQWVKESISNRYRSKSYPDMYTYKIAIERYKLVLLNAVVKKVKPSEKAYICLKLSWLYRGYEEELRHDLQLTKEELRSIREERNRFIENAYEGFISAYQFERFPVCGLQEITVMYLIGDLARRLKRDGEAIKWLSRVIVSPQATERIKNRARDIKEIIKNNKTINTP